MDGKADCHVQGGVVPETRPRNCLESDGNERQLRDFTVGQKNQKYRKNSNLVIHCPTSEGVSKQANEPMDKQVAQYFRLGFWLIWPTVDWLIDCYDSPFDYSNSLIFF